MSKTSPRFGNECRGCSYGGFVIVVVVYVGQSSLYFRFSGCGLGLYFIVSLSVLCCSCRCTRSIYLLPVVEQEEELLWDNRK